MDTKDAICNIRKTIDFLAISSTNSDLRKSLEAAIEALEKKIPQKPNYEKNGAKIEIYEKSKTGGKDYDAWKCPSCGFRIVYEDIHALEKPNNCPKCGQAIDFE